MLNKNGVLYAWRTDRIAAGPEWSVRVARTTPDAPVLTQPAWSPGLGSAYVVGLRNVTRVAVGADCRPSVAWSRPLGAGLQNSSPTLAGRMLWFVRNGNSGALLLGLDPADGSVRVRAPAALPTFAAPSVVGRRLYAGSFGGVLNAYALGG